MTTATAKMIYADKQLAQDILGKLLEKGGETLYDLFQLPHGWQIVRVTKCPKFMPKEVPLPVTFKKKSHSLTASGAELNGPTNAQVLDKLLDLVDDGTKPKAAKPAAATGDVFTFTIKVAKQTPEWWHLAESLPNSTSTWLAKTNVISATQLMDATPGVPTFEFTVSATFAKKKGWSAKPAAQIVAEAQADIAALSAP
jgi:hypothetical protein